MGVNAHININPAWKEPAIIWFVVAAKKGEKKTAALRLIRQALEGIEKERIQEWEADISTFGHHSNFHHLGTLHTEIYGQGYRTNSISFIIYESCRQFCSH